VTKVPFTSETRFENGIVVIDFTGDIDRDAAQGLEAAYAEVSDQEGVVILNFQGVGYINSTGIALIVGILAKARSSMHDISAYGLTNHYRQIFEITRLADFMEIYDEEEAAVAAAAK
jgi:anti-anti-sigma factor